VEARHDWQGVPRRDRAERQWDTDADHRVGDFGVEFEVRLRTTKNDNPTWIRAIDTGISRPAPNAVPSSSSGTRSSTSAGIDTQMTKALRA